MQIGELEECDGSLGTEERLESDGAGFFSDCERNDTEGCLEFVPVEQNSSAWKVLVL